MAGFLSGAAARLLVAALTQQARQDESLRTLGQIAGIPRYQTVREAARELVEVGYAELDPSTTPPLLRASSPLLASLRSLVSARSVQGLTAPGHGEDNSKEIKKEIDSNTIYRGQAFVASEGYSTSPETTGAEGQNEQKVFASPRQTESVQVKQKVFIGQPESVQDEQKVFAPEQKVFKGETESVHPGVVIGRAGSEDGDEGKQAHEVFEDSFAALLAADALPQSQQAFPPDAVYTRRHQAQMRALRAFWEETLPEKQVADHSLSILLRLGGGVGERVAEMILACQERGIERPVGYIRAALTRQAEEREAKHPREQTWDLELAPMTPEFTAELEETRRQAALLWPEG